MVIPPQLAHWQEYLVIWCSWFRTSW
jgi:hypothetical protein